MEEWIKIYSFESQHQAEVVKDILNQNDVKAVVVNAKDSLFLIGEYELYVTKDNEKKAQAIADEYKGLTKVDSFVMRGPIERLKDILESKGINSSIRVSKNPRYVLENYELYVNNEDVKSVLPYLKGDALTGWSALITCYKTSQTRYRIEILNQYHIPSIVIKKRDTKFMKTEIVIYVEDVNINKASELFDNLEGWDVVETVKDRNIAQIHEKMLGNQGIRAIIDETEKGFSVSVESRKAEEAAQLIKDSKKWKLVATCTDQMEADYAVALLDNFDIEAVTVTKNDITLAVDIDIFVDEFDLDDATDILKSITVTENE